MFALFEMKCSYTAALKSDNAIKALATEDKENILLKVNALQRFIFLDLESLVNPTFSICLCTHLQVSCTKSWNLLPIWKLEHQRGYFCFFKTATVLFKKIYF